jgi:hypothetical protein
MTPANRTELIEAIRRHFAFGRVCESPTCLERGYPAGMWCKSCVLDALEALASAPSAPEEWCTNCARHVRPVQPEPTVEVEAQPLADSSSQWLPIETAPKDGRWLLLWCGAGLVPMVGNWFTYAASTEGFWQSHTIQVRPSHWMPLPAQPPPAKNPDPPSDTCDDLCMIPAPVERQPDDVPARVLRDAANVLSEVLGLQLGSWEDLPTEVRKLAEQSRRTPSGEGATA